ncbi:Bidirectional sugar transporter NEC1 [Vitis vinifera]|uniref:Bidirectional sugar transporter NEC1 n=1 Tax=Vitis vinifera TaxID=29760 RepID=A0A438ED01_VITVI|nr:Bidirectional sugar transporter NEC1 [Vitis vinifera]RVX07335.1 Bidirectional sugar transporter NEC1 [Vitis vinifera]
MDVSTQCSIIRLGDAAHHVLFSKGRMRFIVVGWISAVVNLATFAAPLSIIIVQACDRNKKCKSTCPSMSFLTICSTMWFFYGIFVRDFFIAIPNVVGFVLRVAQTLLYIIYKYMKKSNETTMEQHEKTTKGLQYVPSADHEPSGIELKVATCKSPHQVDYFNEHHPMFMERDEYLS